jgi:type II secretory pathway pseudopilin PulG
MTFKAIKNSGSVSARSPFRRAFTIIELLVAVGVTALLVSLMLGIVVNITGGWNRSSGTLESGNQARIVLDQLTSDLQSAILRNDGNVWMVASTQTTQPALWNPTPLELNTWNSTPQDDKLEDYRFGPYGIWLRFFTTVPGTNVGTDLSAPRAVAYQIARMPVVANSQEIRYLLFRSEVAPAKTFTAGYDLLKPIYNTGTGAYDDPSSIRTPSLDSVIANNVVDFGVRIFDSNGTRLFPQSSSDTFLGIPSAHPDYPQYTNVGVPEYVEVFVRILSGEGAQQLALFENPPTGFTPTGTWWDVVQAHSRVYTRRIDLKTKGL